MLPAADKKKRVWMLAEIMNKERDYDIGKI
jgi:hypothetical protein